ncbi:hypothetical protein [Brevibacterium linens]|uniref:Uncharacterized protein n=1 Tax=Brevibacterium linens TaxID=1703 RepID=A0A0B9AXU1_BRELN|nr:hypothetical protein [Brevibacterium linens]KHS54179.1 hypothetical protein AE0388_0003 [Brevibacterium linens]
MKAARAWSVRPTELVEWGERDRVLAEALIEFEENAYCPGCGQLKSKAWDPASEGSWDFATIHCYACAHNDGHAQDANDKTPGELRFMTLDEKSVKIAKARARARARAE